MICSATDVQTFALYRSNVRRNTAAATIFLTTSNKFAQSNLGRGPRRGAVAHIRRKVPIGYNGVPKIRTQKYPFP